MLPLLLRVQASTPVYLDAAAAASMDGLEGAGQTPQTPASASAAHTLDEPTTPRATPASASGCWIGWDLSLHPQPLQAQYWREQARTFMQWDCQVCWCLLVLVTLSVVKHSTSSAPVGPDPSVYIPAWLVLTVWLLLAIWAPKYYVAHRVPLVVVLKSLLAVSVLHITNDSARLMRLAHQKRGEEASYIRLVFQAVSISGIVHLPGLCVGIPLPFWVQIAWALTRAGVFVLGAAARALVTVGHSSPVVLQDIAASNVLWARLVQSGKPWLLDPVDCLQGHSPAVTALLASMHLSTLALSIYAAYISQWSQMRRWLRAKASACLTPHAPQRRSDAAAGRLAVSRDSPTDIGGALLSPQQLLDMCRSDAATLLLDGQGLLGRAAMCFFHAAIINTLLLASWLLSHALVLHVAPRVLPRLLLSVYFFPSAGADAGVCGPEYVPQLSQFVGRALLLLGGGQDY